MSDRMRLAASLPVMALLAGLFVGGSAQALPGVTHTLTVNVFGKGTVTRSPDLATYADGSTVQLTATPAPGGWGFSDWSAGVVSTSNPVNVVRDANKTVNATFVDIVPPTVTLIAPNGGEVMADGLHFKIRWTATDNVEVVGIDLAFSRTGIAGPWANIGSSLSNTGVRDWVTGLPVTTHALIRVTAHDGGLNTTQDVSDAEFAIVGGVGVGDGSITAFALGPLSPNPVRDRARFEFSLPREARVHLGVYDLLGRERLVLADDLFPAGRHPMAGTPITDAGLDPGLYFLRMTVPGQSLVQRFLVTR